MLQGVAYEPDDRPPVLLFGVVRVDGSPVYGSPLQRGRASRRCASAPREFGFGVRFDALALLPGKYRLRVHALDAEGLRMCDTLEIEFVVTGETRDYGLVELSHALAARPRPRRVGRVEP